jgi:hypothetical protein
MSLDKFSPSIEEMQEKARRIHTIIKENRNLPDFAMGVPSSTYWDEIATRLKKGYFRKPFLISNKSWVRDLMTNDSEAFAFLAYNIRIELIVNGSVRFWDGIGMEVTRSDDDPLDFLKNKLGPFLFDFILGTRYDLFLEVLENLKKSTEK